MSSEQRSNAITLLQAGIAVFLFGLIPVIVKFVTANPYTIGVVRLTIGTAGLFLFVRLRGKMTSLSRGDVARVVLIGVFFFIHWLAYFLAVKASSASVATMGISTYGVHLLILSAIFQKARLHAIDITAVAMAVVGAFLIVPEFTFSNNVTVGMALAATSGFFYATLPILHQRFSHISSEMRALMQFAVALLCFLMFLPKTSWDLRPIDWGGLAILGFGSTLIGHGLWVRVTTQLSPATTSIVYYGNVPVALALSVLVLGEPLRGRLLIGGALIVGGSILGLTSQWRRRAVAAAATR